MARNRTALLAWELGDGLGHAKRLLTIAAALRARGWSAVVAARDLWACASEYRAANIPMLQAPSHRGVGFLRARSFADLLAACGYREIETLLPPVLAWDGLIEFVRPDVIVADFAPLLALSAHGRIPVLAVGDGFVLPPAHLPRMPALRSGPSEMPDEPALLANAVAVQRQRKRSIPPTLPSLIGGQAHVVCTYPETDIYADLRVEPASGPLDKSLSPLGPPSSQAAFAYLDMHFAPTAKLIEILAGCGFPVEMFVRDLSDRAKGALRETNVRVHETPPSLAEVAERSRLIVHHGGIGTAEIALALGRPQFLLPKHLEQSLNAASLRRLGTATRLKSDFSLAEGSAALSEAVSSKSLAESAQDVAARLAKRPSMSLERIVGLCEKLAGAS